MEDAILFMVHYLQEVQGPKYVVGRDIAAIAASPENRRLFLSTAKHLLLQASSPRRLGAPSRGCQKLCTLLTRTPGHAALTASARCCP